MIYNSYTYLFIAAIAAGAALAVLIRTLIHREARRVWDISSVYILILLIIVTVFSSVSLFFIEPGKLNMYRSFIFFIILFPFCAVMFYFLRKIGLLIIIALLLGAAYLYSYCLSEYIPFTSNNSFNIYVLQDRGDSLSLEIRDFNSKTQFINVRGESPYPVFTIVNFHEYLFFLQSSMFIRFEGILNEDDNFTDSMENNYRKSKASKLPLAAQVLYEAVTFDRAILSSYKVDLDENGAVVLKRGKY